MQTRIILVSDDSDFFEYITPKLVLRKQDELFKFSFEEVYEKMKIVKPSLFIINSEGAETGTLDLLKHLQDNVCIVFSYNENEQFKINAYTLGALSCITPLTPDKEMHAQLISALNVSSLIRKNKQYRDMLVKESLISSNNEVFNNYTEILDEELKSIKDSSGQAVLAAISPNENNKFFIQPNTVEKAILNNIRKNDVLMTYAANKYFLLLYDTDIENAQKIWIKIQGQLQEKMYAGFASVNSKTRQQLVNEVLNKLHEAINYEKNYIKTGDKLDAGGQTFKMYRQEFNRRMENIITPVFYHTQQKYNSKLFGVQIEQSTGDGIAVMAIKSRNTIASLKITTPGLSKINIDIMYNNQTIPAKRVTLEPDELEAGLLEDLIVQFIEEFKKEIDYGNT